LREPGEYKIHSIYHFFDKKLGKPVKVVSNRVSLIVTSPVSTVDKQAYAILRRGVVGEFLTPEMIPYYRDVIRKYPSSRYATYAKYYLAYSYEWLP
jgi:hypothetical protein